MSFTPKTGLSPGSDNISITRAEFDELRTYIQHLAGFVPVKQEVDSRQGSVHSDDATANRALDDDSVSLSSPSAKLKQDTLLRTLLVTAAPSRFEGKLDLRNPWTTHSFLEKYAAYKIANPAVARTMNLVSYIDIELLTGPLGLRDAIMEGKADSIPDAVVMMHITAHFQLLITDTRIFCAQVAMIPFGHSQQFSLEKLQASLLPVYKYLHNVDTFYKFLVKCSANNDAIPDEADYDRKFPTTMKQIVDSKLSPYFTVWEDHVFKHIRRDKASWTIISAKISELIKDISDKMAPVIALFNSHLRSTHTVEDPKLDNKGRLSSAILPPKKSFGKQNDQKFSPPYQTKPQVAFRKQTGYGQVHSLEDEMPDSEIQTSDHDDEDASETEDVEDVSRSSTVIPLRQRAGVSPSTRDLWSSAEDTLDTQLAALQVANSSKPAMSQLLCDRMQKWGACPSLDTCGYNHDRKLHAAESQRRSKLFA